MELLIRALKEYINEQKKDSLKRSLSDIKTQLDYDSIATEHLHYALYKFQDAVISVLRGLSIKPHWMFALDNILKNSVHVSLMILSPGLGENLAGHEREDLTEDDDGDELSNSGVSTVNSTKVKHLHGKDFVEKKFLMEQVKTFKIENTKLLNDLIETQKNYQNLVKSIIQNQAVSNEFLRNLPDQITKNVERSISYGYFSEHKKSNNSIDASPSSEDFINGNGNLKISSPLFKNPQLKSPHYARQMNDPKIIEWLIRHGFDEESRHLVTIADFTYEDLLFESDKDDIRRIGLR